MKEGQTTNNIMQSNTIPNTNASTNTTIIDMENHQSPNYVQRQYYSDQQQDDHSTSLIVEDYDFTSSAESESSSNLFESEPLETTRMLKRKKSTQLISLSATSSSISLLSTRPLSPSTSTSSLPPIYSSCSTLNLPPLMPYSSGHSNSLLSDCPSSQFDQHSKLTSTNSADQFSHSHHYRTSTVTRKTQQASTGFDTLDHQPLHNTTARFPSKSSDSPRRSKRSWFSSSRRQKRKNSIHALSASSLSSSTSLHSPSLSPREHKDEPLQSSSKFGFANPARQQRHHHKYTSRSHSPFRRSSGWARNIIGLISRGFRSISPFIPSKKPLVIVLALVLTASFLAGFISFLIHFFDTDRAPLPWRTYCQSQREFPHVFADSLSPVTVFVGVFSIDSAYERRHLIRLTYARHSRPIDRLTGRPGHNVQLKFIIGRPRVQHLRRVALEMETFNDLVVLDIDENMNRGKTYAYFRWAAENATIPFYFHRQFQVNQTTSSGSTDVIGNHEDLKNEQVAVGFRKADFVVKADDDAFIVLSELERHLRVAPRTKTYWGYLIRNLFMGGECYALSSDLVDYVATSPSVLKHLTGAEDKKVAKWMRIHPNATAINWVTERCWIYDHPKAGTTYAHGFLFPDEVSRIRAEGRLGLTDDELERRGGKALSQSFSTVTKFGEQYLPPRSGMTMEEEVEALIEGGGKFDRKGLAKIKQRVPVQNVLFEADDARLSRASTNIDSTATTEAEGRTPPVLDHDGSFRASPAVSDTAGLKFGRPPSELLAGLPPYEELVESAFKQAIARHLADQQHKFIDPPALRYDVDEMQIRLQRFEGRPYGGTVVVHYLKRNEWFLETELVLLGKAMTWDDGLDVIAHPEPRHQQPTKNKQTAREAGAELRKGEVIETIEAGGSLFGGARMYGSPAIKSDGRISEGSREDRSAPSQDTSPGLSELSRTVAGGAGWVRGRPKVRVSDMDEGPIFGANGDGTMEKTNNGTQGQAGQELGPEEVKRAPVEEEVEATKLAAAGESVVVDRQLRLPVDQRFDRTGAKSGLDVGALDVDTEVRVGLGHGVVNDEEERKAPGEGNVIVAMPAGTEEKNLKHDNQTESLKPSQLNSKNSTFHEAGDDQSILDQHEVKHREDDHQHHR